jgi:ribosomal protein S18 acetylase RimI-like enzyme
MNDTPETVTVLKVPTGLQIPPAMQEAQEHLLGRLSSDGSTLANNMQASINSQATALIFAVTGAIPQSIEDWQAIPTKNYAGTLTLQIMQPTTRTTAHIDDVVVDTGHEGQGIGKKLMAKAIEIGRKNGVTRFDLTSQPDKIAAQVLYEKVGFKKRETNNWRLEA